MFFSVLYWVWKYFYLPVSTQASREREYIDTDRMFCQLVWEEIVKYAGKKKIRLERFFIFLLN